MSRQQSLRRSTLITVSVTASVGMAVALCACRVSPTVGGAQAGNSESSSADGTSAREVTSTPFAEDEFWILASDTTTGESGLAYLSLAGLGNSVDTMDVVTDILEGKRCRILSSIPFIADPFAEGDTPPAVQFEFDGRRMRVVASGYNEDLTRACTVELTLDVDAVGTQQVLLNLNAFDARVVGEALVDGERVTFGPLQLNRVRKPVPIPCDEPLASLEGLNWSLSSVNFASATFSPLPPSLDETVVTLSGAGDRIDYADVTSSVDRAPDCYGYTGTVTFDGTRLTLEAELDGFSEVPPSLPEPPIDSAGEDFTGDGQCVDTCEFAFDAECDDGRDGAVTDLCPLNSDCSDCGGLAAGTPMHERQTPNDSTCSVQFTGLVSECGIYVAPLTVYGIAAQVIRIDGSGTYTQNGETGSFSTLYLTVQRGGNGSLCGVGMIGMLPFAFLGITGLRLARSRR
ncbi:MAG: hypothetical protein HY763_06890 [Planctomycetes bacterium]|nr:hypothetical protein [Planctomycetota bacterium]